MKIYTHKFRTKLAVTYYSTGPVVYHRLPEKNKTNRKTVRPNHVMTGTQLAARPLLIQCERFRFVIGPERMIPQY